MSWHAAMRELRAWVQQHVDWRLASLVAFPRVASSSSSGETDAVEVEDGDSQQQRSARRVEPFGFRSRPPAGVRAAIIKALAGATNAILFGVASSRYGPSDLDDGEVALYCLADGSLVKLTRVGRIEVSAADDQDITLTVSGTGDVVVNSGSHAIGRVGDAVKARPGLAAWLSQVESLLNAVAPGSVTPLSSTFIDVMAEIAEGADHFKG
jgi:phage gp45-like